MKTIEGHKAFPYIAWTTLLLFSLFTYNLVLDLKASVIELGKQSNLTQATLQLNAEGPQ